MGMVSMAGRNPKGLLGYLIAIAAGLLAASLVPNQTAAAYTYILVSYHVFLAWTVFLSDDDVGLSLPLGTAIFTHAACVFLVVAVTLARHYIPFFGLLRFGLAAIAGFEHNWIFKVSRHAPSYNGPVDLMKSRMDRGLYEPPTTQVPVSMLPNVAGIPSLGSSFSQPSNEIPVYQPIVSPQAQPASVVVPGPMTAFKVDTSIADSIRRKPTVDAARVTPVLNATVQDHEDWLRERANGHPTHRKPGMSVKEEYEEWLKARYRSRGGRKA